MAQVTIRINGYAYSVGCADGQEGHLQAMASEIDQRVDRIKALGSQSGESRLLVLAALLMADEIHDLHAERAMGNGVGRPLPDLGPELAAARAEAAAAEERARHAEEQLFRYADRVEDIADALERH
jgi:cell division protein ZapA